ncbi:T-lymphocyte surface antigen Ly-9-like isoform X2 [Macrotis lagotis]|uniref:T-lymphocyte surface antigen Ly-9-like isoform X2 n=1 Tax=Macrotis lagotis TaxID=92651 RepID=UPI003D69DB53
MTHPRLWSLWLLCLFKGPELSKGDPAPIQVIGILRESVTFLLEIPKREKLEDITWSKQGIITVVTPGEAIKVIEKKYKDRVRIISNNYSLQINNLRLEDSGVYRAQINIQDSNVTTTKEYNLQVYEKLRKPQIRVNSTVSEDGQCIVFLTCSVNASGNNVTYSWSPMGPDATVSHGGSVIQIPWTPCNADWNYTCTARNPASSSSSHITTSWDLCSGKRTSEENSAPRIVIATLGDLITFPLNIPSGVESVVWISNTSLIKKKPEKMGKMNRVNRDRHSAQDFSLQIPNVQMKNQGLYIALICTNSSRVLTTHWYSLQVYKSEKNRKACFLLLGLLGLAVPCWYVWKKKRQGHYPDCCSSQNQKQTTEELPEYKKLEIVPQESSKKEGSLDNDTTSEDNMVLKSICKRTMRHDPIRNEGDMYDSDYDGEEIYDPDTPEEISYVEVNQEKTPNPRKYESPETIYCLVKKPQKVRSLINDPESPEVSPYENFTPTMELLSLSSD